MRCEGFVATCLEAKRASRGSEVGTKTSRGATDNTKYRFAGGASWRLFSVNRWFGDNYAKWLAGYRKRPPIVADRRKVRSWELALRDLVRGRIALDPFAVCDTTRGLRRRDEESSFARPAG